MASRYLPSAQNSAHSSAHTHASRTSSTNPPKHLGAAPASGRTVRRLAQQRASDPVFDVGIEGGVHEDLSRHGIAQRPFGGGGSLAGPRGGQPQRYASVDQRQGVQQGVA